MSQWLMTKHRQWGMPWCAIVLVLSGCAFAHTWVGPYGSPNPTPHAASRVVVSGFYELKQQVSVTNDVNIQSIKESVYARDMSLDVASGLRSDGLNAVAKEGAASKDLNPGEIIVRGALIASPTTGWSTAFIAQAFGSLFVLGGILPFVYPPTTSCKYYYRVELVNPQGEIFYGKQETFREKSRSFWGWDQAIHHCPRNLPQARTRVIAVIAKELTSGL